MTNADKFLKDGVSAEEFAKSILDDNIYEPTEEDIIAFLNKQVTPTIKEMVYTKEPKREVLATGYYFGLLYYVLSLGTQEILEEVKKVCLEIVELGKKPHLTEDERVILRNLNSSYIAIKRNNYGLLLIFDACTATWIECQFKLGLFQFIKERRRI